jgi:hypothetical protein
VVAITIYFLRKSNNGMNLKVYGTAKNLPAEELAAGREALFGSILGIPNHLPVRDTMRLNPSGTPQCPNGLMGLVRGHPKPFGLSERAGQHDYRMDSLNGGG